MTTILPKSHSAEPVLPFSPVASPAAEPLPSQPPQGATASDIADGFQSSSLGMLSLDGAPAALAAEVLPAMSGGLFASNAILGRYQPTGASQDTASQDGLAAGVNASQRMADTDRQRLQRYKDLFLSVAREYGLPPAVLAAIASRESRAGAQLDSNGWGRGDPNGYGLMQVDRNAHTPRGGPYSLEHVRQAASILSNNLDDIMAKFPSWPPEQQLRGAIAAYNFGVGNVRSLERMDIGTTGNDYSNDVWARAQHLASEFGGVGEVNDPVEPLPGQWQPAPSLFAVRSTPETFLRQGMEGESVRQLQQLLGLPAEQQDGKFGDATRQAVMAFQQANGLTPPAGKEGWVGKTTLEALELAAYPEQPGQTYTPAPSLQDVRTAPETFLRQGMEGESVRQLQRMLGLPEASQTGKFDERTQRAVLDFQASQGLTPPAGKEGWVGKTTLEFLEKASGVSPEPGTWTPAPSLDDVRAGTARLQEGMEGEAVKHVQKLLGLAQTGKYDAATKKAVNDFQWEQGLKPPPGLEGVVGQTTLEFLEKAATPQPTPTPGTWTPAPSLEDVAAGRGVLQKGMQGEAVKELQRLLGFPAEEQDGKFGEMTHQAVLAFQRERGLTPPPGMEGHVGKTTLEAIRSAPPLNGGRVVTGYEGGRPRSITVYPIGNGGYAQAAVARNFKAMVAEARAAGINLTVNSGFRSNEEQAELYRRYLNGTGNKAAPPGYSNHQMGLSIDIGNVGGYNTRAYNWLRENGSRFGFVNDVAGEFWHWTYTRDPARLAAVPSVAELSAVSHNHSAEGGCC